MKRKMVKQLGRGWKKLFNIENQICSALKDEREDDETIKKRMEGWRGVIERW